jgi:membrane-bound metal-dependent hydrolase YbcI (DUF457 family)
MFLIWPGLRARLGDSMTPYRRLLAAGAVLAALMGPDFDLIAGLFTDAKIAEYHNGPTHSFIVAIIFGLLFAVVAGRITGWSVGYLFILGTGAYVSHVLIDMFTWGRGVQAFWPITDARVEAPFIIFRGVQHSSEVSVGVHLLNLANDALFALIVWIASGWIRDRYPSQPKMPSSVRS